MLNSNLLGIILVASVSVLSQSASAQRVDLPSQHPPPLPLKPSERCSQGLQELSRVKPGLTIMSDLEVTTLVIANRTAGVAETKVYTSKGGFYNRACQEKDARHEGIAEALKLVKPRPDSLEWANYLKIEGYCLEAFPKAKDIPVPDAGQRDGGGRRIPRVN